MLDSIGRKAIILKHTDASTSERSEECAIHEPVQLAAERKSRIREQTQRVDWLVGHLNSYLLKASRIVKMLSQSFTPILIGIHGD